MPDQGHIELERSVDSITVGNCHRRELGDLTQLIASIDKLGLLQPITVAPDGTLICGRRRLEAIRTLKWQTVKVWVRSGLSDELNSLLAWQDENTLHKPLSPTEAATLCAELEEAMREDGARRQAATRYGASKPEDDGGGVESTPPSPPGKTRAQAAQMVTGRDAHQRLARVNELMAIAEDPAVPREVRDLAQAGLDEIEAGKSVAPIYDQVLRLKSQSAEDKLDRLAREALERVKQPRSRRTTTSPPPRRKRSTRAFVHIWTDMDGWSARYDAAEIGEALTEEEWAVFERVLQETSTFHQLAQRARRSKSAAVAV